MKRTALATILSASILVSVASNAQAPVTGPGSQGLNTEQRLDRLERILQGQGLSDMLQQLQQLQREISSLRGEIETQNFKLDQLTSRQRDLYTDVDQRIQRLEQGSGVSTENVTSFVLDDDSPQEPPLETLSATTNIGNSGSATRPSSSLQVEIIDAGSSTITGESQTPPETQAIDTTAVLLPEAPVSPVTAASSGPADPVQLQAEYQQAFNLLRQSLYDQAIRAFQQFLAIHPNDRYSDNAQYWLAEAFYVKREFEQALVEYNNLVDRFPNSQKVNDALLKKGFALYEMGETDAAKTQLLELIEKLPNTTVARLADERLKIINSAAPITPPVAN